MHYIQSALSTFAFKYIEPGEKTGVVAMETAKIYANCTSPGECACKLLVFMCMIDFNMLSQSCWFCLVKQFNHVM